MNELNGIGALERLKISPELAAATRGEPQDESQSFGAVFQAGVQALNDTQVKADTLANQMAAGEDVELHDVMIATQEADIALRLATQLRNQALEAYREIMRMPI